MKKITALLFLLIFLLAIFPNSAQAAVTHTLSDGETLDLSTGLLTRTSDGVTLNTYIISNGDTINVSADATAIITGSRNVMIECGSGVTLTVSGVSVNMSGTLNTCALSFTGSGNTLILSGENFFSSGSEEPGIRVEAGAQLEITDDGISGDDLLTATGGSYDAGIGGGKSGDCGTIIISGGSIIANGGNTGGAGIGGGAKGDGGNVTISGGNVTANGGENGGAGIGGGYIGSGGKIYIKDGSVTSNGGDDGGAGIGGGNGGSGGEIYIQGGSVIANGGTNGGAGIGGGEGEAGGYISISGGSITANGGYDAAGIGTGYFGSSHFTDIDISGGKTYANSGGPSAQDVGHGKTSISELSATISNGAVLLLENNTHCTFSTPSGHVIKTTSDAENPLVFSSNSAFGVTVPAAWTGSDGGYFRLGTVAYNLNGGSGTTPASVTQHYGTNTVIDSASGISRSGYAFDSWNTASDGSGNSCYADTEYTFGNLSITLYAQWLYIPTPTPAQTPRKSKSTATPTPAATPEPTVTPTEEASAEPTATPSPPATPTATPIPVPISTMPAQVSINRDGTAVIIIDVSDLPEGTTGILLPNGEIIPIGDAKDSKLTLEVKESWISDGTIELIALDDEQTALGYYNIDIPLDEKTQRSIPLWLMILGGFVLLFWIVFAFARIFRTKTNPRYKRR